MPHDLGTSTPPVVVRLTRGEFVESVHRAHVAVVAPSGEILARAGDPDVRIYPRSSLKPLFAATMVDLGLPADEPDLLALVASSHSGEPMHVEGVARILARHGLAEEDLANTPAWPYDERARDARIATGRPMGRIEANCSGKHAAMVAVCRLRGWSQSTYLTPEHPLRTALGEGVALQTGDRLEGPAVDGCGAPVWRLPLSGLARGFAGLVGGAPGEAASAVADAMRACPEYVGGSRRHVTAVMRALPGIVAKDGADGVYAVGLPDGRGIALKVEDGSPRALAPALAATLRALGYPAEQLAPIAQWERVLGGGRAAGRVEASVELV
jgi:L-asparaginase II